MNQLHSIKWMETPGIKPTATGCEARMLPLCYCSIAIAIVVHKKNEDLLTNLKFLIFLTYAALWNVLAHQSNINIKRSNKNPPTFQNQQWKKVGRAEKKFLAMSAEKSFFFFLSFHNISTFFSEIFKEGRVTRQTAFRQFLATLLWRSLSLRWNKPRLKLKQKKLTLGQALSPVYLKAHIMAQLLIIEG